jgi:predicted Rdx family selenoprotein
VRLAEELLDAYAPVLRSIELRTSSGGRFEVSLDGALLFSKDSLGRFPLAGEIISLFTPVLGRPLAWREPN